ncbi:Cache 3/Cache 2 fusion domain-containing protein [Pseudoalteromonas sp. MMG005]|uniref:PDC sensor domain-containing protein n=1 Tax=Pseudoalteromonas sp. MMG005 TaxID=2822682 RepID=UPI001B3A1543|nr:Cache 3/Cache 2 fusion domain-containing protein [Pseudoalteromonas sp. MMG005]MBQ4844165.1 Cache 3/Cache 2 fusion domain-containing protein [Pseudoalteromonas sp. MMG005]
MTISPQESIKAAKSIGSQLATPVLAVCLIFSVLSALYCTFIIYQKHSRFQSEIRAQVQQQTFSAAQQVGDKLAATMSAVDNFAQSITALEDKQLVPQMVEQEFNDNLDLFSLNVTFHPYKFERYTRYFSPYFERLTGVDRQFNLVDYDKPDIEFSWYHRPLKEGPIWTEPYYEPQNSVLMSTYSVPFFASVEAQRNGDAPIGVVPSDVSLDYLTTSLKKLKFGLGGYGTIFSTQQNLISHPVFSFVREGENAASLSEHSEFKFLKKVQGCFAKDLTYLFFNGETMDNDEHYAACTKIPHTDWVLITRMSADMFEMDKDARRQMNIVAVSCYAAALMFAIFLLTRQRKINWTQNNISVSLILVFSTVTVLEFARSFNSIEEDSTVVITSTAQREALETSYRNRMLQMRIAEPNYVATGIYVESIEFVNANNVHLTGLVWQKLTAKQRDVIPASVNFNEAIESTITEQYRKELNDGGLVVGWYFSVITRQQFDYSKYPFDHKNIVLRLKGADLGSSIVLVPDLEAYEKLGKRDNPAMAKDIVMEEWRLKQSYFKYTFQNYNTNFGMDSFVNQDISPELNYSINIEREFLGPFVTTLLPVMVMVCLLYACIVSMAYTPYGDLRNNITAVVFTILLAHYSIREHLQIDEVVYFEIFYFLLYFLASIFMFIAHKYYKAQATRGNAKLYKKIAGIWFWPVLTTLIFMTTISTYY